MVTVGRLERTDSIVPTYYPCHSHSFLAGLRARVTAQRCPARELLLSTRMSPRPLFPGGQPTPSGPARHTYGRKELA